MKDAAASKMGKNGFDMFVVKSFKSQVSLINPIIIWMLQEFIVYQYSKDIICFIFI